MGVKKLFNDRAPALEGNPESARRLLESAKARGAPARPDDVVKDASDALRETLAEVDAKVLAGFLKAEQAQTVALVMAHLDARRAGDLLKLLAAELRTELMVRLANLGAVEQKVLADLDDQLKLEIEKAGRLTAHAVGGAVKVAALLNVLGREQQEALLGQLESQDQKLAAKVRREMFTFADLAKLDDRGMQELLKAVPAETLRLALKPAPEAVLTRIFGNLSERARTLLQDDLAARPKVKLSDVEAAQRQLAELAQELAKAGRLVLNQTDEKYV